MTRRHLIAGAGTLLAQAQAAYRGVTVMPEYIQVEGIDGVLNNLQKRARVTAVCTSPYVMEPDSEKTGSREPPIDAGAGSVRLLDRPLWGKRELFVRTAPSFTPAAARYQGLRYQPSSATDLTKRQGGLVRDFVREAKRRGLEVWLQVQAAIPPGYRVQFGGPVDDDRPKLPDGRIPARRVANNGSLASLHIRAYHEALLRDLAEQYPEADGLRVDWPEYPPYFLDDVFLDFSAAAAAAAKRYQLPFGAIREEVLAFYRKLHGGLTARDLEPWLGADGGRYELLRELRSQSGLLAFFHFKGTLTAELLGGFRLALRGTGKKLVANAFPPPFSFLSGMDFGRAAAHVDGFTVKLYTMHWPMMLRFWAEQLLKANPGLPQAPLVEALERWMDISDEPGRRRLAGYRYPEPNEPHPAGYGAQVRKLRQARRAAGDTPVFGLAHGYGQVSDFRRRLKAAWEGSGGRIWVNRYGYLSDAKLEVIGEAG